MIRLFIEKKLDSPSGQMHLQVDTDIAEKSLTTLYGKSGAGKTSVLRMLAGLFTPDSGNIVVNGTTWLDTQQGINLSPQRRKVGVVFQDYALFPNMSVLDNLNFALEKGQDKRIVDDLIAIVELGELQKRKPETLSGGQKQRVALARALVKKPDLLLLDEPLSALDREMRIKLQQYILQLHRDYGLTTILVSHDVSEILKMSDTLLELEGGKVVRKDAPTDVFAHKEVSGKFQFTGEVVAMEKQGFIFILTILIGKEVVKVIADEMEARNLTIGDQVLVASKAFNPIIRKIN